MGSLQLIFLVTLLFIAPMEEDGPSGDFTKDSFTIGPGEIEGREIVVVRNITIKVDITSDVPINVYILNEDQHDHLESYGSLGSYEKVYWDRTSVRVGGGLTVSEKWYVALENPSGNPTASVVMEYDIADAIIRGIWKLGKDNCCCTSALLPAISILGLAVLIVVRRRA